MKTQNNTFFQALGKTQLTNLVKEVKETVAANVPVINAKNPFSIVNLWSMDGTRRNRISRRHTGLHTNLL